MPYMLTIGERGHSWAGRPPRATLHATREEAEAELLTFVQNNWDRNFPTMSVLMTQTR